MKKLLCAITLVTALGLSGIASAQDTSGGGNMNRNNSAQTPQNRPSPADSVSGKVGQTTITINYSSPAVRGRQIWGKLVPYDKVWRSGANEATTVSFDRDVKVEGKALPAGTYAFFTIPTQKSWTVIFSKTAKQNGTENYKQEDDALRVTVKPRKASTFNERLKYVITGNGFALRWENLEVPVTVK